MCSVASVSGARDSCVVTPVSIRDAAVACSWLAACLDGREPADTALGVLGELGIRAPDRTSWLDIVAEARSTRSVPYGTIPAAAGLALLLPRAGDARGLAEVPPEAYDSGAAVLLCSGDRVRAWLVPGSRAWSIVVPPGATSISPAASWLSMTPRDADIALRGAVLAASTDLEATGAAVPRAPDATGWQELVRAWEEAPWPGRGAAGTDRQASPDVALGIRGARILAAVGAGRAYPRGLTSHDESGFRSALEPVDRAARDAVEVAFSRVR